MRIAMISSLYPPDYDGGFELNAQKIALALRARGHDVQVVTSEYRDRYTGLREDPGWVHRILTAPMVRDAGASNKSHLQETSGIARKLGRLREMKGNLDYLSQAAAIAPENERRVQEWLKTETKFDVAYVGALYRSGTSTVHPFAEAGTPLVWHYGDEWVVSYLRVGHLKRTLLTLRHPQAYPRERSVDLRYFVLNSGFLREQHLKGGFSPEQTYVIHRGIEFPLMHDVDRERDQPPVFLMAARIALYKGHGVVLDAAARLHKQNPSAAWEVQIAGEGELDVIDLLKERAGSAGITHRIKFLGKLTRAETVERMRHATAFISASVHGEAFANTIIEALASGTPLIGSLSGSIREVATDDVNALLYPKEDSEALTKAMDRILHEVGLAPRIAAAGVKRIEEAFTMDRIMDQTERFLGHVVRSEDPRPASAI